MAPPKKPSSGFEPKDPSNRFEDAPASEDGELPDYDSREEEEEEE